MKKNLKIALLCSIVVPAAIFTYYKSTKKLSVTKHSEVQPLKEIFQSPKVVRAATASFKSTHANKKDIGDTPKEQPTLTPIQTMVHREAIRLYNQIDKPNELDKQIKEQALRLNHEELNELKEITIDSSQNTDERIAAVYFLKKAGAHAHHQLQDIFFKDFELQGSKPAPHSIQEKIVNFEYSIRTTALSALEENIHNTGGHLSSENFKTQRSNDPYLNGLLNIVKAGEKTKQPLLEKFIDKSLTLETL